MTVSWCVKRDLTSSCWKNLRPSEKGNTVLSLDLLARVSPFWISTTFSNHVLVMYGRNPWGIAHRERKGQHMFQYHYIHIHSPIAR